MTDSIETNHRRQAIVDIVRAEERRGEVFAALRSEGESDGSGRSLRRGWSRLMAYFDTAAPQMWPAGTIKYLPTRGVADPLPAWCALFALWAMKSAGIDVGSWTRNGISTVRGFEWTRDPKPGDVGYIDAPYQHHCIVVEVSGSGLEAQITTVDGNSGSHQEVTIQQRKRRKFTSFYTARPVTLLDSPIGNWDVKIGWRIWRYTFFADGIVRYAEVGTPKAFLGEGRWDTTDRLRVAWPASGSRDEWDAPLFKAQQGGTWFESDGRTSPIAAVKVG